jgi:hypothetical protein
MTDGQSASLSWCQAPIWGLWPDFYYCQTVAGLLMWGALSHERMGLPFTIAAGPRQRSHSWVRVPRNSWPYFTVSDETPPTVFISSRNRVAQLYPWHWTGLCRSRYIASERTTQKTPLPTVLPLVHILCFWKLSIVLSLSKNTVLFIFQNTTFRRLDSVSIFRQNLLSWAQSTELVPISEQTCSSSVLSMLRVGRCLAKAVVSFLSRSLSCEGSIFHNIFLPYNTNWATVLSNRPWLHFLNPLNTPLIIMEMV